MERNSANDGALGVFYIFKFHGNFIIILSHLKTSLLSEGITSISFSLYALQKQVYTYRK